MYHEAADFFAKMRELYAWSRCFLAFCLMKSGDPEQARSILKAFQPSTLNLSPSALMDVILPDVNPDFRKDFLDTIRRIETTLSDDASQEHGGSEV